MGPDCHAQAPSFGRNAALAPRTILSDPRTMRSSSYPVTLSAGKQGGYTVTFPDLPEAITYGKDRREASSRPPTVWRKPSPTGLS